MIFSDVPRASPRLRRVSFCAFSDYMISMIIKYFVFSNEHSVLNLLNTHIHPQVAGSFTDTPVNQAVHLVQEGDVAVDHVGEIGHHAVVIDHHLLDVLILRGVTRNEMEGESKPVADLLDRDPDVAHEEEVEEDQVTVRENVCLSGDRHD